MADNQEPAKPSKLTFQFPLPGFDGDTVAEDVDKVVSTPRIVHFTPVMDKRAWRTVEYIQVLDAEGAAMTRSLLQLSDDGKLKLVAVGIATEG